jgi:hypothetical protein
MVTTAKNLKQPMSFAANVTSPVLFQVTVVIMALTFFQWLRGGEGNG